jgi:hypothetical protein
VPGRRLALAPAFTRAVLHENQLRIHSCLAVPCTVRPPGLRLARCLLGRRTGSRRSPSSWLAARQEIRSSSNRVLSASATAVPTRARPRVRKMEARSPPRRGVPRPAAGVGPRAGCRERGELRRPVADVRPRERPDRARPRLRRAALRAPARGDVAALPARPVQRVGKVVRAATAAPQETVAQWAAPPAA